MKKAWLLIKRIVLFLFFGFATVAGLGIVVSSVITLFDSHYEIWWHLGGIVMGLALIAIGIFMMRVMLFGSNKDVEDTDITGGFN